jgi:hypothetical protein
MNERSRGVGELRRIAIGELRPNPFRRLDEYPIVREKVDALKRSIASTGFWGTIVGRPADDGRVEIAFGHHRLVSLRESLGPEQEVEIIVRELTNEDMLRMMADENLEEWGSSGWVEIETVRATIDAHGRGLISLPRIPDATPKTLIRHVPRDSLERPYTKTSVAQFLGWTDRASNGGLQPNDACIIAFDGIDALEDRIPTKPQLYSLSRYKMKELVQGARRVEAAELKLARHNEEQAALARKKAEEAARAEQPRERQRQERRAESFERQAGHHKIIADSKRKQFVEEATAILRSEEKQHVHREVRNLARTIAPVIHRKKTVPDVGEHAAQLAASLAGILKGDDKLSKKLAILAEFRGELTSKDTANLVRAATRLRWRLVEEIERPFGPLASPPGSPRLRPAGGDQEPPFDPQSAWEQEERSILADFDSWPEEYRALFKEGLDSLSKRLGGPSPGPRGPRDHRRGDKWLPWHEDGAGDRDRPRGWVMSPPSGPPVCPGCDRPTVARPVRGVIRWCCLTDECPIVDIGPAAPRRRRAPARRAPRPSGGPSPMPDVEPSRPRGDGA